MNSPLSRLLSTHFQLDAHSAGLVATRTFRRVVVTGHRTGAASWRWGGLNSTARTNTNAPTPLTHAVALFRTDGGAIALSRVRHPDAAGPETTGTDTTGTDAVAPDAADRAPGAIGVLLSPAAEAVIDWDGETDAIAIWTPKEALEEFLHDSHRSAIPLASSPLTIGFRSFALSLLQQNEDASSIASYAIERLVAEMAFGAALEYSSVESRGGGASILERARSIMLIHREDPAFTSSDLAAELHISLRQLQRTFADAGTTPGDELRTLRVDLAVSLLSNPIYLTLGVEEIAQFSGFNSGLQMRRALKSEARPSPTAIRAAAAPTAGA